MITTIELWLTLLGSGVVTGITGWFFGGKQAKKVEIRKASGDAVATMQTVYDQFLSDYKERMGELMIELQTVKNANIDLQKQFNEIQLQYAKETERSQNWEKLHRELTSKYNVLEKEHDALKLDHDALRKQFESYKKNNK